VVDPGAVNAAQLAWILAPRLPEPDRVAQPAAQLGRRHRREQV